MKMLCQKAYHGAMSEPKVLEVFSDYV